MNQDLIITCCSRFWVPGGFLFGNGGSERGSIIALEYMTFRTLAVSLDGDNICVMRESDPEAEGNGDLGDDTDRDMLGKDVEVTDVGLARILAVHGGVVKLVFVNSECESPA